MVRYVYPKFNVPFNEGQGAAEGYHNMAGTKLVYLEPGDGHVIFDETLFKVKPEFVSGFHMPNVHSTPLVFIVGTDGDDKVSFKPTDPNWQNDISLSGTNPNGHVKLHFRTGWGNDELLIYHDEHSSGTNVPGLTYVGMDISQSLGHKLETFGTYLDTYISYKDANFYWNGPQYNHKGHIKAFDPGVVWHPSQKIMHNTDGDAFGPQRAVNPNSKLTFVTKETVDRIWTSNGVQTNAETPGTFVKNGLTYKGEATELSFTQNGFVFNNAGGAIGSQSGPTYQLWNYAGAEGINIVAPSAPCFTRGTRIETDRGEVLVEDLKPGDMLKTLSGDYRALRWVGSRKIDRYRMEVEKGLRPVRILANTFGEHDELVVSPQHRMCIETSAGDLLFDGEAVLASAKSLVNGHSVTYAYDLNSVEYFHLLLDEHEVIYANGALAETLLLSDGLMSAEAIAELRSIFSEEQLEEMMSVPAYGRVAKAYEAVVLTEMMQTNHGAM